MIDFRVPPELDELRTRVASFIRDEVLPVEAEATDEESLDDVLELLRKKARDAGLWTPHLPPEWGGLGVGPLGMALISQECGASYLASLAINAMAPDEGNMHLLLHAGTDAQKERYLKPLAAAQVRSCFAMTERDVSGSDPTALRTRAERDGDQWVIDGEKYFSSHAEQADFLIAMVITNPDVPVHQGASMMLVPRDSAGLTIARTPGVGRDPYGHGHHPYVKYEGVRVPRENLLGGEGQGFAIAQTRLGGGRIHHAMRTVALVREALRMMCERALSRHTQGTMLAEKQFAQGAIADSFLQLEQFRLLVLFAAWHIDQGHKTEARTYIAAVKVQMAEVLHDVVRRSLHLHGAIGCSNEMPLLDMWASAPIMGIADGPTEVHKVTVAKQVLKQHQP
ncbi:MAG: acyl-CoA dehydrogenase family protein, partial [Actinomycetota bacterium]